MKRMSTANCTETEGDSLGRRKFLQTSSLAAVAGAASFAWPRRSYAAAADVDAINAEITKRHDESVKRLQTWIRQPSIAAENRGMNEGCELTMNMLREADLDSKQSSTDGQPGIFATLDAGAPRTVGLYFMYDVKQADLRNGLRRRSMRRWWTSPAWAKRLLAAGP